MLFVFVYAIRIRIRIETPHPALVIIHLSARSAPRMVWWNFEWKSYMLTVVKLISHFW